MGGLGRSAGTVPATPSSPTRVTAPHLEERDLPRALRPVPVGGCSSPACVVDALLSSTLRALGTRPSQSVPSTQGALR